MKNLFSYEGKRVVVAGAGSGMGEATARVVASLGAEEMNTLARGVSLAQETGIRLKQAWALAFLCSDAASYVKGENLFTDGGFAGGMWTGVIDPSAMMPS